VEQVSALNGRTGLDVGTLAVDVANVCLDKRLPGRAGLRRLDLVINAWRAEVCRHVDLHLVIDASALRRLSLLGRLRAWRMRRAGRLIVAHDADEALLDHVERHGGCLLSCDRFLDKRPGRQWQPHHLFAWEVRGQMLRIIPRPPRNTQPYDISEAVERKALRTLGISRADLLALRRWTCESDVPCVTRLVSPDALLVAPIQRGGRPCCPGCEQPLRDRGDRRLAVELKLVIDDAVRLRFTITEGEPLAFGRFVLPDTAELAALAREGALDGLGRRHVELRRDTRGLAARPVDDRHMVRYERWAKRRRRFEPAVPLSPGDFTVIPRRDRLLLTDRVVLMRSGRSIAEAEELDRLASAGAWQRMQTEGI
jgi:hypothetical protein